jgi:hypothetical protein
MPDRGILKRIGRFLGGFRKFERMAVQHFQMLPIGEHEWKAVIAISLGKVHTLLDEMNRVFVMKSLKYDPETCEAIVTLVPGNGMMATMDESAQSNDDSVESK